MMSVGIIGGADGPTAVFVTGPSLWWAVPAAAVVILAIVLICRHRHK